MAGLMLSDYTAISYERRAEIDAYLKKNGKTVGNNDVWIAATARAAGALLLTTDRDFEPLDPTFLRHHYIPPQLPKD